MKKGTLADAIGAVSTISIVEAFDVPHFSKKGLTYLLCPGHDDKHFGSCYIDRNDNGYYCYACGEHVNKWNMVLKLNGNDKAKAATWFFETAGISPTREIETDPYQQAMRVVKKIEPYFKNQVVYNDTHECSKMESSYGRSLNGVYLYSEIAISNPLMEMYKVDRTAFKKIVLGVLSKTMNKTIAMQKHYEKESAMSLYINGFEAASYEELSRVCKEKAENLKRLMEEVDLL